MNQKLKVKKFNKRCNKNKTRVSLTKQKRKKRINIFCVSLWSVSYKIEIELILKKKWARARTFLPSQPSSTNLSPTIQRSVWTPSKTFPLLLLPSALKELDPNYCPLSMVKFTNITSPYKLTLFRTPWRRRRYPPPISRLFGQPHRLSWRAPIFLSLVKSSWKDLLHGRCCRQR